MSTSRNPAKSRPLSANVKRLMRLARASPQNNQVIKVARQFTARDLAYCHKQGNLFMEAASMGFTMADFAPLYMTSQAQKPRDHLQALHDKAVRAHGLGGDLPIQAAGHADQLPG